ncbi:hypothetical protein Tco_0748252 [Tanacetum coccineum]|uniref:Uncharacterized protein n=1 Tax=Tanacetum coccineum TaxID=301880 RepID=A0ABQ4YW16_9ASTR
MFAVCSCARFQVTPKMSHLHAVKRIFRYLKGQPKLGLWYPRDSPFDLEAFSDSDYARASLDRKFTTGGCQFLGKRLISCQCKKQTIVTNSTTEAEEWIQVAVPVAKKPWGARGQTKTVNYQPTPYDSPLTGGYTPKSDEGRLKLKELMAICTKLSKHMLDLEKEKDVQAKILLDLSDPNYTATPLPYIDPKDKGKGVLVEEFEKPEKIKRRDQEEATSAALAEEFDEISRDRIAKQLQEEFDRARQEQEVIAEVDQAHDIDWIDLVEDTSRVIFKGISYEDVRLIFKRVWDQNHVFVQKQPAEEEKEKKNDYSQQQAGSSKKRSREDSDEDNVKKQKLEDDAEKEELRDNMDVVPIDDIAIDVESLATKYPIVDWKTHVLTENIMYYQIIRADGSSKNYKIFSEMLDDFNRQDVMDLHRLVQERYDTTSPKGYDLLLWGDLKILFEPNKDDEIWKNQQVYNLISWRLFDSCGIHILLMHNGIAIHMMIEKKYPLTQEMLSRMLSRRLDVDQESERAFELLRYREYDLAHLKLIFEFSIYNVWKSVQYGVSNGLDTAYWGFLGARIRRIFLMDTAYWSSE